jgi:hypothetical protein
MIKSRKMSWARMGEKRIANRVLVRKPEGEHQEDLDISGRTILKRILEKKDGVVWTGLIWLRIETNGRLL